MPLVSGTRTFEFQCSFRCRTILNSSVKSYGPMFFLTYFIPAVKFFITGRPEDRIRSGFKLPSLRTKELPLPRDRDLATILKNSVLFIIAAVILRFVDSPCASPQKCLRLIVDLLISQGVGRASLEKGSDLTTWCVCKEQTRQLCCESGEERAAMIENGRVRTLWSLQRERVNFRWRDSRQHACGADVCPVWAEVIQDFRD